MRFRVYQGMYKEMTLNQQQPLVPEKKAYKAPQLTVYGRIDALTKKNTGAHHDSTTRFT